MSFLQFWIIRGLFLSVILAFIWWRASFGRANS